MRVLLVDDDPDFLEQVENFFKRRRDGLNLETTISPEEALEKIENNPYDAIVSDYKMPGMNGLELLKRIREKDIDTLFYILTGEGDEETSQKALELGASGYFYKSPPSNKKLSKLYEILMESIKKRQKISGYLVAWITVSNGQGEIKRKKFENALNDLSEIMGFEISEIVEKKKIPSKKENIMAFTERYYDTPIKEPAEAKKWKELVIDEPEVVDAGFKTRENRKRKITNRKNKRN